MFTAILWKEYRQQIPMGVALFVIVVTAQILTLLMVFFNPRIAQDFSAAPFLIIAVVVSAVYSASSAAIVFCNEHEEKTYPFLRNLPIPRGTLLAGKLAWTFGSSLAFLLITLLESGLLALLFTQVQINISPGEAIYPIIWIPLGCVVFPICWGLFWTPLLRSQLHALLASFVSASVSFWGVFFSLQYLLGKYIRYTNVYIEGSNQQEFVSYFGLATFVVVTLLAGIAGVVCGYYWFDIWRDKRNRFADFRLASEETAEALAAHYKIAKTAVPKKRGEFLSLCDQAYRQHRTIFLTTIGMGVITWLVFFLVVALGETRLPRLSQNANNYLGIFVGCWIGVLFIMSYVYCGTVFSADQKTQGAFLAERGVSPGKIWWSRVLTFAVPYLAVVFVGILTLLIASFYFEMKKDDFLRWLVAGGMYLVWTTPQLFVGIFVSLFVRSPVVSIVATAGLNYALMIWGTLMWLYLGVWTYLDGVNLGIPTLVWSTAPLILAFVVASRLRIDDWLRGRTVRNSRRPVGLTVFGTFAAICVVIPFYRVYTIPKVDYGFRADPQALSSSFQCKPIETVRQDNQTLYSWSWEYVRGAPDLETLKNRYEYVNRSFTDPSRADVAYSHYDLEYEVLWGIQNLLTLENRKYYERKLKEDPGSIKKEDVSSENEDERNNPPIIVDEIDAAFLDGAIAILQSLDTERVPLTQRLQRMYEVDYRYLRYDRVVEGFGGEHKALLLFTLFPWERQRALRETDYAFQIQSSLAEKADAIVFHNQGDIDSYQRALMDEYWPEGRLENQRPIRLWNGLATTYIRFSLDSVYRTELARRARILELALMKYVKEKGEFPETLDALKTAGILTEIPNVPYVNCPFFYDPHPDGTEGEGNSYYAKHKPGTPYLWGCSIFDQTPTPYPNRGMWLDLNFVKEPPKEPHVE